MVLKVLFTPASEGITITGALVYFTIPTPVQPLPITEAQVNSWAVMLTILCLCLYLTHGIAVRPGTKRQLAAEWVVEKCKNMVHNNMGDYFAGFAPFIAAIMTLSGLSSLLSLLGLFPPTSDMNVVAGWAILVFSLITYYKFKAGPIKYLKSFAEPVPFLAPMNIISEAATPVSMAFRHYGNILSGSIISVLIAAALGGLSNLVLGWLPGILGEFPFLRIGIPAVLSLYFDIFSGCLQAFIFATLTMMYVSGGFPQEDYEKRKARREARKREKLLAKTAQAEKA
ncbi:MAG: F0F1 ATP synthase subunit A [Clostridia bacterium]|nr:F0F1 ATP synthase subunit A [Clostridia bacterium]